MAIYSFQHKFVSLKQNGAGRAAAGVRYATRPVANHVTYIGFDPNKFVARQQMQAIEDAQPRKDGRIYHLFIGAIPRELSDAEQQHMVNRVAWGMSNGGKAQVIAAIHDQGTHNPHLHLILVDRKVSFTRETVYEERPDKWGRMRRRAKTVHHAELGESVNLLTHNRRQRMEKGLEPNATEWARKIWENVSNEELALAGQDARIDRRTLLEQGIEREAQKHLGIIRDERSPEELTAAANENEYSGNSAVLEMPLDAPTDQLEESPEHAHEQELVQEDAMATREERIEKLLEELHQEDLANLSPEERAELGPNPPRDLGELAIDREDLEAELERRDSLSAGRIVAGEKPVSVVAKVRGAYQLTQRVKELQGRRSQFQQALHWRAVSEERSKVAAASASRLTQAEIAFERQHTHGTFNGKSELRGFQAPSWSILPKAVRGWQSASRKAAVAAQDQVNDERAKHSANEQNAREAERVAIRQAKHVEKLEKPVEGYEWMNPDQQREALQDMEKAERTIAGTQDETMEGVTAESVWEAYKAGEIDAEEALAACEVAGFDLCAETIRKDVERTQGEEMGH